LLLVWMMLAAPPAAAAGEHADLEEEIRTRTLAEARRNPADLLRDERLQAIAREHSASMYAERTLGHVLEDGVGPGERVAREHRALFALISENVAFQQNWPRDADLADRLVQSWMDSPGHRRNILAPYEMVEIGCHGSGSTMFCTQLFARSVARLAGEVPFRQAPGGQLPIRLADSAAGQRLGITAAGQTPQGTGTGLRGGAARLSLPPAAGLYELHLWTRDAADSMRYEIVGGPFICVTRAADTDADCGM
jgi:hypothetical protein